VHSKVKPLNFKAKSQTNSLIRKELNIFFKTPVFIVNAGFSLVLFLVLAVLFAIRFDSVATILINEETGPGIAKDLIYNNLSVVIFALISFGTFMTSITSSIISLEGRNISILKSLPIKTKTILMSKVKAALLITTPAMLVGDLILFIRFRTNIFEALFLVVLSILMPLISHFVGIIINLKYPKLEWESPAEAVKQSTSSFVAVMGGMFLVTVNGGILIALAVLGLNISIILGIFLAFYAIVYLLMKLYLNTKGTKIFNKIQV
jgi:ABC-2 type transport system permease protein